MFATPLDPKPQVNFTMHFKMPTKMLIRELLEVRHEKMDGVTLTPDMKAKYEGFIEALYQVESLIINWGNDGISG